MTTSTAASGGNWRLINIDALEKDSPYNFDVSSLAAPVEPVSQQEVQSFGQQIRQLLNGGDSEGALRAALETAPYGADDRGKEIHLATVIEVLQRIRQAEMTPVLERIKSEGGVELLDTLMKYIYKGMAQSNITSSKPTVTPQATGFSQIHARSAGEGGGQAMSVLLSWHEKLVGIAGLGSIARVMSDRRTV